LKVKEKSRQKLKKSEKEYGIADCSFRSFRKEVIEIVLKKM